MNDVTMTERLTQRALRLHRHVDVDRTDLQTDTTRLEFRQPGAANVSVSPSR